MNREIRSGIAGRLGSESAYRARYKDLAAVLFGQLENILHAIYIHTERQRHILLADRAQQRAEVNYRINFIVDNYIFQAVHVQHIGINEFDALWF